MGSALDFPRKFLLGDLVSQTPPLIVWVQGEVQQTVGTDILILSDGTGRAKVTQCSSADGDKYLSKGVYCCILGTAISTKALPEIKASKMINLSQEPAASASWKNEVREATLLLDNKIKPRI